MVYFVFKLIFSNLLLNLNIFHFKMDAADKPKTAEDLTDFDKFFTPECKSALKKCLTKEIWEEYKDQSCGAGVSFKTCVFSGIANQDSGIGVYAGSQDAFYKFNKLFDQVIQNYH